MMEKTSMILTAIMFVCMFPIVSAVQVNPDVDYATLDDTFNYTFHQAMNFSVVGVYSDRIQLDYTNISIVPSSSTGTAEIYNFSNTYIKFNLCGTNKNVNMLFQNITTHMNIVNDSAIAYTEISANTNYTIFAESACQIVTVQRISNYTAAGDTTVVWYDGSCANKTVLASYSYYPTGYYHDSRSRTILRFIAPIFALALLFIVYKIVW